MRVLVIAPIPMLADRGGSIRVYEELRELKRQGVDVRCVTYHLGRDVEDFNFDRIKRVPYKKEEPGGSYKKFYVDFFLFLKGLDVARKFKPDIIHGHLHEGAMVGLMLRKVLGIPVVMDAQGSLTKEMVEKGFVEEDSGKFKAFRRLEKYVSRKSDVIVVSSRNLERIIRGEFGADRIEYISDGVNTDFFSPDMNGKGVRRKYGLEGKKVVVYTGLLTRLQGVNTLLEAVPGVIKEDENVRFLVVGFPNVEEYRRKAEELGVGKFMVFAGKQPYFSMPEFLAAGDIAVSPKVPVTGEANLKLYTYMASGLPSVVLDTRENRDTLGNAGIYCRSSPKSFADGILKLAKNRKLREKMGREARELALKEYRWEKSVKRLINVYRGLIKKGGERDDD